MKQKLIGVIKSKDKILTIILVIVFLGGLALLLYPTVSNWWYTMQANKQITAYDSAVSQMSEEDCEAYFEAADAFNEKINEIGSSMAISYPELLEEYEDTLDITGTGIMGYITISKIQVQLPIYHGTSDGVLQIAAGHLEGTSLPVGGESTHSVISGHRGLPSATLFTRLDELEIGDTFTITVLNRVLTYEVDQITIVEPDDLEDLYIVDGKDYVTLFTCTPYGINSHRLLVRGTRVDSTFINVSAEATKIDPIVVAPFIAVPLVMIGVTLLLVVTYRKKKSRRRIQNEKH